MTATEGALFQQQEAKGLGQGREGDVTTSRGMRVLSWQDKGTRGGCKACAAVGASDGEP